MLIMSIMDGSLAGSRVVLQGMVFGSEPEGTVKEVTKAKVADFTCALDISQTETKGTFLIKTTNGMLNFTTGEENFLQIFKEIADSSLQVIIACTTVGDFAIHYLNRVGIAALKVLSKFELR
ncbi:hypothetical protein CVT24_004951 [Panaeolus cyanescens]|uniref:Uncharacterized protein n=1 Tax=Panaeolus cyanescens TaxID=181874 RepID=A0A409YB65_9AGAR|nr:hypothetical protein CVT24_004951 [Panaeolus cyanescens]